MPVHAWIAKFDSKAARFPEETPLLGNRPHLVVNFLSSIQAIGQVELGCPEKLRLVVELLDILVQVLQVDVEIFEIPQVDSFYILKYKKQDIYGFLVKNLDLDSNLYNFKKCIKKAT
jgi:hypothetical protein